MSAPSFSCLCRGSLCVHVCVLEYRVIFSMALPHKIFTWPSIMDCDLIEAECSHHVPSVNSPHKDQVLKNPDPTSFWSPQQIEAWIKGYVALYFLINFLGVWWLCLCLMCCCAVLNTFLCLWIWGNICTALQTTRTTSTQLLYSLFDVSIRELSLTPVCTLLNQCQECPWRFHHHTVSRVVCVNHILSFKFNC